MCDLNKYTTATELRLILTQKGWSMLDQAILFNQALHDIIFIQNTKEFLEKQKKNNNV